MNAKKAKLLRKAAGYKNQTATPGVMDFPGVARAVKFPVLETHGAVKTSYEKPFGGGRFAKVERIVEKLTLRGNKPVVTLHTDGVDERGLPLAGTPKFQLVLNSKPGKLRADEPKGLYRAMKRLYSTIGAEGFFRVAEQEREAA